MCLCSPTLGVRRLFMHGFRFPANTCLVSADETKLPVAREKKTSGTQGTAPPPLPPTKFFCGISVSARFKSNGNSWIFNYISERILFSVNFIGWKKWDSCPLKGWLLFIVVCKMGEPPQRPMKTSSNSSRNVAINIPKWLHRETNEKGPTCCLLPPQAVCVTTHKGSWVKLLCAWFQSWHGRVRISWERWEL